jgi:hypothetical protein
MSVASVGGGGSAPWPRELSPKLNMPLNADCAGGLMS